MGTHENLWELRAWELVGTYGNFVRGNLWELGRFHGNLWEHMYIKKIEMY